ncbi:lantibiotic dehydratase [Lentzea sp. NEAU-D7]|uniref:lantibiotic dehydratase n=1 Tax=Lentzea sp. NEAU-D7 TaxID=2994667 RepID=UPI00224A7D46|nr:lantibiotic dehydratase [Lentzea sp. NEAU-D7]MCX2951558.1 lantibiotic dehydratase [Lentzea sp. NEAU-D7]
MGAEIVVRTAGLPVTVLADLRLPHTAALVAHITAERTRLAAEAAGLAAELFELIGAAPGARAALVGLRRCLAPGHRPPSAHLISLCLPVLPEALADRVVAWTRDRRECDGRRAELTDVLAKERVDVLDRIRAACADPVFRRGLLLSGHELTDTLDRWLADPGRPPRQGKVLRLVKYLARASAKTSPFGAFLVSSLAGGGSGAPGPITVPELPGAYLDALLARYPAPLRVNPSLTATGDGYLFAGAHERIVTAKRVPAVDLVLGKAEHRPTRAELVSALAEAGAEPEEAARFCDRLVRTGLLVPCSPVSDDDPDPFGSWAELLDEPLLRELSSALRPDGYHRSRLAAASEAVAAHLGVAAETAHEAEVSAHRPPPPALPAEAIADLDAVRRWFSVFDWKVPVRVSVGEFCRDRYGEGSRTPFLVVCRDATAALPHLFGRTAMPWFADLSTGTRLRHLDRLRGRARALAARERLTRADVLADIADWPDWLTSPAEAGCYLQVCRGEVVPDLVVLNGLHAGHGRAGGRLRHLLGRAGISVEPAERLELPLAELGGRFGFALNVRTPGARYEIDLPGAASSREPGELIGLGELEVVHDPATDLVSLHSERFGPVQPVHLGMMGELALPPVAGFLERAFAPTYLFHPSAPPLISVHELAGTTAPQRFPRVTVGSVVVQRARWTVPAAQIPRHGGTDAEHLLALAEWRRSLGIPHRCFVRGWRPGAELGKSRKPNYVDFAAWHLVALFDREVRSNSVLVFDEALPDPLAGLPGQRHVTEYHVEVGGNGG